ncbi:MAG TPA: tRNA pseudouridine(38-40) synthase TruA [Rhabdochlamydiaceae bacterium]|jgi:tRNA pseudouridine38-40 synthase
MRNLVLTLSYLGTPFKGWQKTRSSPTIEEAVECALLRILRQHPKLQAASRTDAGVHAEGQIVNFLTDHPIDLPTLARALNGTLPKEVCVLSIEEHPLDFHPTLHCQAKEYRYQICNGPVQLPFHRFTSWHIPDTLHLENMQRGAELLLGTHDFSAFCNERALWDRNPVCHLQEISFAPLPSQRLRISIIGDHFLYKMVRNIVGTLVHVGWGKIAVEKLSDILESKDRTNAGVTAPAHGLSLYRVYYNRE